MSRIPVPSHSTNYSTSQPTPSPFDNNMSSRPSARRPESVYSSTGSYLSSAAPPGTPPAAAPGDGLAETRKRQSRRDEVSLEHPLTNTCSRDQLHARPGSSMPFEPVSTGGATDDNFRCWTIAEAAPSPLTECTTGST